MSPLMSKADKYAAEGNQSGIVKFNFEVMAALGLFFSAVVVLGVIVGSAAGTWLSELSLKYDWFMNGLSEAGGMMR